jgi:AraC family transcriptional regulator
MLRPVHETRSTPLMFGSFLADVFRTRDYDCLTVGSGPRPEFAVTRLRAGPRAAEEAWQYPADRAILVWVSLAPAAKEHWHGVYNGQAVGVTRAIPFATTFVDLTCRMDMWVSGPFDYVVYYLSVGLLQRIALDHGVSPAFRLRAAFFVEDLVVAQMTRRILAALRHGEPLGGLAFDDMAMILGAHTLQRHRKTVPARAMSRRGLEAWQKLRTEEMLRARVAGKIAVKELASACCLSESHFARCFRQSFGISVHQHLIQLRIERAKELLCGTATLADIALMTGFCDQASLTRSFGRVERVTPARWRRINQQAASPHHRFGGREQRAS